MATARTTKTATATKPTDATPTPEETPMPTDATPTTDAPTDAPAVEPTPDAPTTDTADALARAAAHADAVDAANATDAEAAVFAARMEDLLTILATAAKGHTSGNSGPLALCIRSAVENCRPTVAEWAGAIENGLTPFEPTMTEPDKDGNRKKGGKYAMPSRLKAAENTVTGLEWLGRSDTDTLAMWEPNENELISLLAEENKIAAAIKKATAKDSAAKKAREDEAKQTTKNAVAVANGMEKAKMPALIIDAAVRALVAETLASGVLTLDLVNAAFKAGNLEFRLSETAPEPAAS